jgi:hypothetical protein
MTYRNTAPLEEAPVPPLDFGVSSTRVTFNNACRHVTRILVYGMLNASAR